MSTKTNLVPCSWPKGKSCAVVISVDVDEETPYLWKSRKDSPRCIAELEQRRFGPRVGLPRLLDMFSTNNVKASFFVPAFTAQTYPWILPRLLKEGHEIGLHGYLHEPVNELSEQENAEVLDKCLAIFLKQQVIPSGYRSPGWVFTPEMPSLLEKRKILYDSSLMGSDRPYMLEKICELPVSWTLDDAIYFFYTTSSPAGAPAPIGAEAVEKIWLEEIDAARRYGNLAIITVHPWIIGSAPRVAMLERVIQYIKGYEDIWLTTCDDLVRKYKIGST